MNWDKDAKKAHEILPVPPMMLPYARLQSEKIARHKGRDLVTVEVVKETEKIYRDFVGKEIWIIFIEMAMFYGHSCTSDDNAKLDEYLDSSNYSKFNRGINIFLD